MAEASEIKELMRQVVGANPNLPIIGTVVSVEGDSCTVQLSKALTVSDVKLKASIGGDGFMLLTPKKGSKVRLLSLTGSPDNFMLIAVNEVEKMEYKQDGLNIIADSTDGKVSVKNNEVSLFSILNDLAALLKKITVSTPNGPSGTPLPPTIQAVTAFEQKIGKLLK